MDIEKAIINRRSTRAFKKGVTKQEIESILNIARFAPSAGNLQLWKTIAVTDSKLKEKIITEAGVFPLIKDATPVYVFYKRNNYSQVSADIQSAAAFVQNILLSAYSRGISSLWMHTGGGRERELKRIFHIPSNYYFIACVLLGYSSQKPKTPERKQVQDFLSYNFYTESEKDVFQKTVAYLDDIIFHMSPNLNDSYPFGSPKQFSAEMSFFSENLSGKIGEFLPLSGTHSLSIIKEKKLKNYSFFEYAHQCERFTKERLKHNLSSLKFIEYKNLDSVFCAQKLEFYPADDLGKMFEDMKKGLKKNGKFAISFRSFFSYYTIHWFLHYILLGKKDWQKFTPLNPYYVLLSLRKQGFKVHVKKGYGVFGTLPFNLLTMLFSKLVFFEGKISD